MYLLLIAQIVPIFGILGIMYLVLFIYRQYYLIKKSKTPFTENALLRLPGHSLDRKIRDMNDELAVNLFALFLTAIVSFLVLAKPNGKNRLEEITRDGL